MTVTLPPPLKLYRTEYTRELYRNPFGKWEDGYQVVEEVWVSLNGETHVWDNGYETCTDPIAIDQAARRYRCYQNRIDYWGGRHWCRGVPGAPKNDFFYDLRNVQASTLGLDGKPLKVRP